MSIGITAKFEKSFELLICFHHIPKMGCKKTLALQKKVYSTVFCIHAEKSEKSDAKSGKHTLTITVFKNNF